LVERRSTVGGGGSGSVGGGAVGWSRGRGGRHLGVVARRSEGGGGRSRGESLVKVARWGGRGGGSETRGRKERLASGLTESKAKKETMREGVLGNDGVLV